MKHPIYEDPFTQLRLEGWAELVGLVSGPEVNGYYNGIGIYRWVVRFEGDERNVVRTVLGGVNQ